MSFQFQFRITFKSPSYIKKAIALPKYHKHLEIQLKKYSKQSTKLNTLTDPKTRMAKGNSKVEHSKRLKLEHEKQPKNIKRNQDKAKERCSQRKYIHLHLATCVM